MSRDWPADLWPTSFAGIPFWVTKTDAAFGVRLQKDEFPEVDDPLIQPLGAAIRTDTLDAYLVGDTSDADADAFVAALIASGGSALVLPTEGPVQGFFETGRRAYQLDRQGWIGLSLTFVRGGSTLGAGVTADYLAQMVTVAADAAASAATALLGQVSLS